MKSQASDVLGFDALTPREMDKGLPGPKPTVQGSQAKVLRFGLREGSVLEVWRGLGRVQGERWIEGGSERKHKGSGVLGTAFLAGERNPVGSRHTGRRPFAQIVQGQSYFRTCALALWLPGALFPTPYSSEVML